MTSRLFIVGLVAALGVAARPSAAATNAVPAAPASGWEISAGADLRVRQEIMNNLPGLPGEPTATTPAVRAKYRNQFRFRPRVWLDVANGPFRLYTRLTDEFRHFPALNAKRHSHPYYFPDELILDNLYLEGKGLESETLAALGIERIDFRFGRQDLLERGHSIFGLDRLVAEGTPLDGSRSFYSDMARMTFHFDDTRELDVFALYDSGRNDVAWGTRGSRDRSLNCIHMSDTCDLDEAGAGLIYTQRACDGNLPFKLYTMFKHNTTHMMEPTAAAAGRKIPAKQIALVGFWAEPHFGEQWSLELENGKQFGRFVGSNRQAGGWMSHTELKYRPDFLKAYKPVVSTALTWYSGDRHTAGANDNDMGWDPMWARYTLDSEMLVYGTLYGNCWWSNVVYAKAKLTMNFGPHHALYAYTGPMFAAVQDDMGTPDGSGSMYKGFLTAARYDFPIWLAPKGATGLDRFEVFAHLVFEMFQPGDYYESSRPAYFVRWQFDFKF